MKVLKLIPWKLPWSLKSIFYALDIDHTVNILLSKNLLTYCVISYRLLLKKKKKNKIIIMGDLNINLLEHWTHNPTNNFLASLQTMNFYPHISRPTRFPDNSNLGHQSLFDHIFTTFNNTCLSGIIRFLISDHLPVFLNICHN